MREGELLYFTLEELEWLLELSGGPEYSVYSPAREEPAVREDAPDGEAARAVSSGGEAADREEDTARTLASLYQRGFLREKDGRLVLSERGGFFREMRAAPLAVMLTARYPRRGAAVCYAGQGPIWVAEQLATSLGEECRLWKTSAPELERWLFSSGMLHPPRLSREDAQEWNGLLEDIPAGEVVLRLERCRNGGGRTGEYEVLAGCGTHIIRSRADGQEKTELYTREALRSMLRDCFGLDEEAEPACFAEAPQKGTP